MNKTRIANLFSAPSVVLTGHYGSGKTEISINLAMMMSQFSDHVVVVDLDIANPYFRSRELDKRLNEKDIRLVGNAYGYDIAADLPALSASAKSFLGNDEYQCVVDVGGNGTGARVLNQYRDGLHGKAVCYMVVNIYRPETDDAGKIIEMIHSIEAEMGTSIDGLINNSNMLRETMPIHIVVGHQVLKNVSERTGIPIIANCVEERFVDALTNCCDELVPISLYMRPHWLDM